MTHILGFQPTRVRRRLHQFLMAITACAVLGCSAMVVGPIINDHYIESNPGRALALVTDISATRTTVEFQDEQGLFQTPETGLLYPSGLGVGQRVWVTYAKDDPSLVKVEGRRWTLSVIPALSTFAVIVMLFVAGWMGINFGVKRWEKRNSEREQIVRRERRTVIPPRVEQ